MTTQPDLFIFDLDGTLADTAADIRYYLNETLREYGMPEHGLPEVIRFIGNGSKKLVQRALPVSHEAMWQQVHDRFLFHYDKGQVKEAELYPGVMDFLRTCTQNMAILTNKPTIPTQNLLKYFGIESYFKMVVCGDSGPAAKPHPEGLGSILAQLNCSPERALMVGDSLPDVQVARTLGVTSCALLQGFGDTEQLLQAGPDLVLADFREFCGVFSVACVK
jgi:phosphoglycolate phosphatase